jgi:hypothetical protein
MSMLEAATTYAERGLLVFPLRPRDKIPATSDGFKSASAEPERVQAMWSGRAACNVGVACGSESGVLVLDIDGDDGRATLAAWEAEHEKLPATPTVATSKGFHFYFRHPGDSVAIRPSAGKAGKGIDIRTDGSYVVAPPSIHPSGAEYAWCHERWLSDLPLAPMPDWLIAKLADKPRAPAAPYEPSGSAYGHTPYGQKALDAECMELSRTSEGGRNAALNQVAFRVGQLIASGHLAEGPALADLERAARACGLEERETRLTIASGVKGGREKPNTNDPDPRARRGESYSFERGNEQQSEQPAEPAVSRDEMPADEVMQRALAHYSDVTRHKLPRSGFGKLDNAIGGYPPGALITLGGRTGAGKSSLMLSMALKQIAQTIRVGVVSCEDPDLIWGGRLLAAHGDVDTRKFLNAQPTELDTARCNKAIRDARNRGLTFSFQIGKPVARIVDAIKRLVEVDGAKVIYVDYLQAIAAKGQDRYMARTDALQELKGLCYDLRVPLVMGSQLKRPENGNPFREPNATDLKDSGDIENMSEVILLLWPKSDEQSAPVFGKVAKVKWSDARPRFQLLRSQTNGTIVDLIDGPKESAAHGKGDRFS